MTVYSSTKPPHPPPTENFQLIDFACQGVTSESSLTEFSYWLTEKSIVSNLSSHWTINWWWTGGIFRIEFWNDISILNKRGKRGYYDQNLFRIEFWNDISILNKRGKKAWLGKILGPRYCWKNKNEEIMQDHYLKFGIWFWKFY